jgi:hypothetical protein
LAADFIKYGAYRFTLSGVAGTISSNKFIGGISGLVV